jgi:hypothetical protein
VEITVHARQVIGVIELVGVPVVVGAAVVDAVAGF